MAHHLWAFLQFTVNNLTGREKFFDSQVVVHHKLCFTGPQRNSSPTAVLSTSGRTKVFHFLWVLGCLLLFG